MHHKLQVRGIHRWPLASPWEWLSTSNVTFININDVKCVYMVTVLHDNSLYSQSCYKIYYIDVIMSVMASQITSFSIVYSTIYSGADRRKHQRSPSLAYVRGIHRWPVNSPHKGPVMRKIFPFDDVIMHGQYHNAILHTAQQWYWAHCWVNIKKPHPDGWAMVTKKDTDLTFELTKYTNTSPSWASYGVSIVNISDKIYSVTMGLNSIVVGVTSWPCW